MDEVKAACQATSEIAVSDGYLRIAAATPKIRVGMWLATPRLFSSASTRRSRRCARVALPELCLTGYTCGDLFHDRALLRAAESALAGLLEDTADTPLLFTVGLPVAHRENVYNCVAACCAGRLLGLTVKRHLPNYGEFYEQRWFAAAPMNGGVHPVRRPGLRASYGRHRLHLFRPGLEDVRIGVEVVRTCGFPTRPRLTWRFPAARRSF